jgi:poly(3-hydroxyalkanoate) synthetase
VFQGLVSSGNGLVIGRNIAKFWGNPTDTKNIHEILQTAHPIGSPEFARLEASFRKWNSWTIDVPGKYYLEVVEKLYKRNELARGNFVALGQRIDLARLRLPIYLLAGRADDVVAPEQALAVERLVGTAPEALCHQVAPCNHLSLFMGRRTLEEYWPAIVRWLKQAD